MPTPEDIARQRELLTQYRQSAHGLLLQIAKQGGLAFALQSTLNGLAEARKEIAKRKANLRAWGVAVEDLPDDVDPHESAPSAAAEGLPQQPAPASSLYQIRSRVPDFVGREDELARLVAVLRSGAGAQAVAISGVRGMGGIGKTQLALAVAEQLRADYPDAQLPLDLNGTAETPLSPEQALQQIIRTFRPEDKLPEDLPALQRLYHALLHGKRVLILADDVKDADQVRPLLPPAGCALLITSRLRFSLDGMTALDLDRLDEEAALQLLHRSCDRLDDAQARQIALLCGRLPLALRISAGILANNPALSVARYLTQLADERKRLDQLRDPDDSKRDVEATLYLSYRALDTLAQVHFRRLGVLAADADRSLIAGVLGLKEPEADKLLGLLLRRNLVEYDTARERWGLHNLVRAFALARLSPREEQGERESYAKRVIKLMEQAQERYLKGGEEMLVGLAQFDRERAHLDAVRAWLWKQPTNFTTDGLCFDEANATVHIGDFRDSQRAVRIRQWERGLAVVRRRADREGEVIALTNLGNVYSKLGEFRTAIIYQEQALAIARRRINRRGEEAALSNLGNIYRDLGEVRTAITYCEQALIIAREMGDRRGEGSGLGNLGNAYLALGEALTAISYYKQALVIAREIGDRHGEGNSLGNLGGAYQVLGEVQIAIGYYEQDLAIVREMGDRRGEGITLGNLGNGYGLLGEARTAVSYYEQYLAIAREVGDRHSEGSALGHLANAYWSLGEASIAINYCEQYLAITREVGDRRGEGNALGNLGVAYIDLGEVHRAISYQEQALSILRETNDRRLEGWVLGGLGTAQVQLGDTDTAILSSKAALHLAREVGDRHLEGRVLCDLGTAHALLDQHAEADSCYQQSLEMLDSISHPSDAARTRWAYGQHLVRRGQRGRGVALMAECAAFEERIGHARAAEHAALVAQLRAEGEGVEG